MRVISWFSCGAASAVATKLAIESSKSPVTVVRCWVKEEHPDNDRFAKDCEKWFGQPILTLKNMDFDGSVHSVIRKRKFIKNQYGAPCTMLLKKKLREDFQLPDDVHVFGYTAEPKEVDRYDRFIDANPTAKAWPVLIEHGLSHADCLALVKNAGIILPVMYEMGYMHNNCIGCVKGGMGYWNKIRTDFPLEFKRMAVLEREVGFGCCKDANGTVFLDQLDPSRGNYNEEPEVQCSLNCELIEWNDFKMKSDL